jgi:hypothetical protein
MSALQITALISIIIFIIFDFIIIRRLIKKNRTIKQIISDTAMYHALVFFISRYIFANQIIQVILFIFFAIFLIIALIKFMIELK